MQLCGAEPIVRDLSICHRLDRFKSIYEELQSLGLEASPFVLISVVGQELLSLGHCQQATDVLEAALRFGTNSLKLKQSVLSSLSSAYWALSQFDKAQHFMQQDLAVATSLGSSASFTLPYLNLT